jgi:hypothetical protein
MTSIVSTLGCFVLLLGLSACGGGGSSEGGGGGGGGNPPPLSNVEVLTYHNDNSRSGLNPNETILTTANVGSGSFGMVGSMSVSGLVDAEPLYVGNLNMNGTAHNVLFVATEQDVVYAFDADTFALLWQQSVLGANESPSDSRSCGQISPSIGVTSTPVIDLSAGPNGTIFLVSMSKDSGSNYHHRLHALDLVTHAELNGGPTEVQASVSGTATGSVGGTVTFVPSQYKERASLLLLGGTIYTTWASNCDDPNYTGWVIGYSEATLQRQSVLNVTANGTTQGGKEGGIWMAGSGPAADSAGAIYLLVGNGTFDTTLNGGGFPINGNFGNAFLKLTASGNNLTVADYFVMHNACCTGTSESNQDTDLGSGGVMLLPDLQDNAAHTWHLAVGAGKDGFIYVVNRDSMGKFNPSNDKAIYQKDNDPNGDSSGTGVLGGGIWSAPAYFNNIVYYGPNGNKLLAFSISNAKLSTAPASMSPNAFGYPGVTPSVSANGTANGIVWAIANGNSQSTLYAYDATNLANQLYQTSFADNVYNKYVTPLVANGRVYVGTPNAVLVFGLLNP